MAQLGSDYIQLGPHLSLAPIRHCWTKPHCRVCRGTLQNGIDIFGAKPTANWPPDDTGLSDEIVERRILEPGLCSRGFPLRGTATQLWTLLTGVTQRPPPGFVTRLRYSSSY